MRILPFVTYGCWWAFIIVWLLQWRGNKASVYRQDRRARLAYSMPFLLGTILLSTLPGRFGGPLQRIAMPLLPRSLGLAAGSALVAVAGLALALWARSTLGRNWSAEVTLKADHELVTSGPYAAIRHPIYSAIILLVLGLLLLLPSVMGIAGLLLIVAGCWVKLRQEEALMLARFPQSYPAYMARTRRLVPLLV